MERIAINEPLMCSKNRIYHGVYSREDWNQLELQASPESEYPFCHFPIFETRVSWFFICFGQALLSILLKGIWKKSYNGFTIFIPPRTFFLLNVLEHWGRGQGRGVSSTLYIGTLRSYVQTFTLLNILLDRKAWGAPFEQLPFKMLPLSNIFLRALPWNELYLMNVIWENIMDIAIRPLLLEIF